VSPVDPVTPRHGPLERARRSAPGVAATDAAKRGLRLVGLATADLRPGPDLLVIGAKRGGTTSLWRYLSEHPGVLPTFPRAQQIKGTYFFDEEWHRGSRWYRSHFPTTATRRLAARRLGHPTVAFEASPYYLFHPLAPERARLVVPDAPGGGGAARPRGTGVLALEGAAQPHRGAGVRRGAGGRGGAHPG
jgi:hypothetical protein